jgi:hypothetical protein
VREPSLPLEGDEQKYVLAIIEAGLKKDQHCQTIKIYSL